MVILSTLELFPTHIVTFVGTLRKGVPRLACVQPVAWPHQRPCTAHLHQQTLKTLARRTTQDLLGGGLTRLAREGRRDKGKGHLARFL